MILELGIYTLIKFAFCVAFLALAAWLSPVVQFFRSFNDDYDDPEND